jgi:hypothetical protein
LVQSATAQNGIPPPSGIRRDAIADAQTPREVPKERSEQNKTPHDLSDVFAPSKASPSSEALIDQPESGGMTGFDFYRDPLGAMKPGTTFEEIDNAAVANKPTVSAQQRKLLESRYNLEPRLDPKATKSRGKPLVVGPTARLPQGTDWAMLGASGAIHPKEAFRPSGFCGTTTYGGAAAAEKAILRARAFSPPGRRCNSVRHGICATRYVNDVNCLVITFYNQYNNANV